MVQNIQARATNLGPITPLPPSPYTKQPQKVMDAVTLELKKSQPDQKKIFAELAKLSPGDQVDYVRKLRLEDRALYQKLGSLSVREGGDMKTVYLLEEPKKSAAIVQRNAKMLARAPDVGDGYTLRIFDKIHPGEREEVLRAIKKDDPRRFAELRAVCARTEDPELRAAMKNVLR